jgi:hypothetical protein
MVSIIYMYTQRKLFNFKNWCDYTTDRTETGAQMSGTYTSVPLSLFSAVSEPVDRDIKGSRPALRVVAEFLRII